MKYKYLTMLMLGTSSFVSAQDASTKDAAKGEAKPVPASPADADNPAEAKPAEQTKKSLAEQIDKLIADSNTEQKAFMKRVRAIEDRKEAMALYRSERPPMAPTVKKIIELAKQDPGSDGVVSGLAWAYGRSQFADKQEALDLLLKHHKDSNLMARVVSSMSRTRTPNMKVIRGIMYSSNNEMVRQSAMYTLTSILKRDPARKDELLAMYKQLMDWPNIQVSNKRLYEQAKSQVFVIENLSVGKAAPDIVGTDQDDKEFKLSDYSGKVVLLDFWGIW